MSAYLPASSGKRSHAGCEGLERLIADDGRVRGLRTESKKKEYMTPEFVVHGDIDELTRNGSRNDHKDVPYGTHVLGHGSHRDLSS